MLICGHLVAAQPLTVQELVSQFSATNYQNTLSNKLYTRQGMNRAPLPWGGQHDLCRDAIYDEFQRVGLSPYKDFFTYIDTVNTTTVNACNIIAVKEGVQNPDDEIYVVGSHYDSKDNPGADDNATGVACQLEMARIFSQQYFAKTIVFCIFDAEERYATSGDHRLGSLRYVDQHLTDNIQGMISVDMIGWEAPGNNSNKAFICGRTDYDSIRSDLRNAMQAYGEGLSGVLTTNMDNLSDHYSFEQAGFSACLLIEAFYTGNPNYHHATDYVELPGYLDWDYLRKMCRSVIGYYGEKLQPVDVTPAVVSIQRGSDGTVLIHLAGLPLCKYATELCTNLASPAWIAIETNTASATDGSFATLDAQAASRPVGFYRARFVSGFVGNPNNRPVITTEPLSRVVGAGQGVGLSSAATGQAPLNYQWTHNGSQIPGATNSGYAITSAQTTDAGAYALVVFNDYGSVTSRVASLTVYPPQTVIYADNFDTDTSGSWTVNKSSTDTRATFRYDYSADGIPSAPHSTGGTTRGVKLEANMTKALTAALSMSPAGHSFSGDYRLRFDMWINANGPFPDGGRGSTQHLTGGIGTSGSHVQWTGSGTTADGYWFAVDGEGGAGDTESAWDYGALIGTALQSASSGVYAPGTGSNARRNDNAYCETAFPAGQAPPAQQQEEYPLQQTGTLAAGSAGFAWREVIISRTGNTVEWSIDGVKLATITNATFTASNVFVGYWDAFSSISDNTALSFGLVDNLRVEVPTSSP